MLCLFSDIIHFLFAHIFSLMLSFSFVEFFLSPSVHNHTQVNYFNLRLVSKLHEFTNVVGYVSYSIYYSFATYLAYKSIKRCQRRNQVSDVFLLRLWRNTNVTQTDTFPPDEEQVKYKIQFHCHFWHLIKTTFCEWGIMFSSSNMSPRWLPRVNFVPWGDFTVSKMEHMLAWANGWPREACFTSVNYLQWCIVPAAGKSFCFWPTPHICFPRYIRHLEKLRKRNGGLDVCCWLLFSTGLSNTWEKGAQEGFLSHTYED